MSIHFNENLLGITKDCGVCCCVWLVPGGCCIIQAKAVQMAQSVKIAETSRLTDRPNEAAQAVAGFCVPYMIIGCLGTCIGGTINRASIRTALDIEGNCISDYLVWCYFPECAACQEYREANRRYRMRPIS